jgi:hypothetical protein
MDKTEYFIGDNKPGKIKKGKVTRPNFYRMSSKELKKWESLISRELPCPMWINKRSAVYKEFVRISEFINLISKKITITHKELAKIIKNKRNRKQDVIVDSVAIEYCQYGNTESELKVEYY